MVKSTGDTNLRLAAKNRGYILQKRRGFCGGLGTGYMIRNAATGETIAGVKYDLSGEERQKAIEEIETAGQESDEFTELTNKYLSLSEEVKNNKASKEDMLSVQDEVIEALGLEGESVDELTKKYGTLSQAILEKSLEKLREKEDKLRVEQISKLGKNTNLPVDEIKKIQIIDQAICLAQDKEINI